MISIALTKAYVMDGLRVCEDAKTLDRSRRAGRGIAIDSSAWDVVYLQIGLNPYIRSFILRMFTLSSRYCGD